ncbi:MAG TPA: DoxX family protein [Candidatus Binatia bacterium]
MNVALWIIQALLALLFLFAGGAKLVMSVEEMTKQIALPGLFLRFIAVCEILGALGLVLPWLLRIRPGLTSLAAAGLLIIMIGATALTLMTGDVVTALLPLVVGLLCAFVAYGRWRSAR